MASVPGSSTHKVKSGETLSGIAKLHGTTVGALKALNAIGDANKISAGQLLRLPGAAPVTGDALHHVVVAGDTLGKIAARFGVSVDALKAANKIKNENLISIGQVLRIEGVAAPAPSAPAISLRAAAIPAPSAKPLGELSKKFETSGRGPGTVSHGQGDPGGVSYGSYQLASRVGTLGKFMAAEGKHWAPEFGTATGGSPEFTAVWKAIARREPETFHEAQHAFIERTHYGALIAHVKARTRVDLSRFSHAIRDVVWSTSVQHGGASLVIERAMARFAAPKPGEAGYDKALIEAVYAERGKRNEEGKLAYFKSASAAQQAGVAKRFVDECRDALAMLAAERAAPAPAPAPAPNLAPRPGIAGPVNTQLPKSGTGFVIYNPDDAEGSDRFGLKGFVQDLIDLGIAWSKVSATPVSFGDMSRPGGKPFPPHKGHRGGNEVDVRPFRTDGKNLPMRWDNPGYDGAATRKFMELVRARHADAVIFFNDPKLITAGLAKKLGGHDDHLHIRIPQ